MGRKKSVLYYDLQGSSKWNISPPEKSEVKSHCHDFFENAVRRYRCDEVVRETFRGDDAIAYFDDENDCAAAAIHFFKSIPEMIRMCPHLKHDVNTNPRIIMFNDNISGDDYSSYTGRHIEAILPQERDFGKAGTIRIVGELWHELNSTGSRKNFKKLQSRIKGKSDVEYDVYEFVDVIDVEKIRSRHVPPYLIVPSYEEQLYKFFSNNLAARNSITMHLIKRLKTNKTFPSKDEFIKSILISCRGYLEMTVSSTKPAAKAWNFKLSYWALNNESVLYCVEYSYPEGMSCVSFERKITVQPGENIIGKCFNENKIIVQSTSSDDYIPLHGDRASDVASIAAFPIIDMTENKLIGVLAIDAKHPTYCSGEEAVGLHAELLSSFTANIALASYI